MSINEPFLIKTFSRLKEINQLGQGYLFFGENSAGRNNFLRSLLVFLERGSWEAKGAPPLLESLEIKPIEGTIGIEAAREVVNFLSRRPVHSPFRVVAITDAENLTREAQNALLKIVEEPPPYGIILISARDPELLAPALVSRLARVFVSGENELNLDKMKSDLAQKFLSAAPAGRKAIIKALTAEKDDIVISGFINALIVLCRADLPRHHALLKELLRRNALMASLNTNKKLQLEALLVL